LRALNDKNYNHLLLLLLGTIIPFLTSLSMIMLDVDLRGRGRPACCIVGVGVGVGSTMPKHPCQCLITSFPTATVLLQHSLCFGSLVSKNKHKDIEEYIAYCRNQEDPSNSFRLRLAFATFV